MTIREMQVSSVEGMTVKGISNGEPVTVPIENIAQFGPPKPGQWVCYYEFTSSTDHKPNPCHVFVESVISDIAQLPERDNDSKYVMRVSIDELRAVLARRLWDLYQR